MPRAFISLFILIFCLLAGTSFAQREGQRTQPSKGVINGRALVLPKPEYSDELKNLCASGEVKLQVNVTEAGDVLKATVISGDELLHESSIKAVKGAKFQPTHGRPVPYSGIVVYNFPSEKKCVDVGVVNGKWVYRPKFSIPAHAVIRQPIIIQIRLAIDVLSGNVIAAKIAEGHPLIRAALEKQALSIRFHPTFITTDKPPIAKGWIKLTVFPNRMVKL